MSHDIPLTTKIVKVDRPLRHSLRPDRFGVCCDCGRNTVGSLSSRSLDRFATARDRFTVIVSPCMELLVFGKISELLLDMLLGSF